MIKKIWLIMLILFSNSVLANLKILPDSVGAVSNLVHITFSEVYSFEEVKEEIELLDKNFDGLISIKEGSGLLISSILPNVKSQEKLMTNYKKARQKAELDKWLKLINKKERSEVVLIAECKKAQRDYYFYNRKIKRNVFTGLASTVLLNGQSVFNPNKHEVYTLQRDNAESFLEINNCSAYGIYK